MRTALRRDAQCGNRRRGWPFTGFQWAGQGSNLQHPACKASALPLSYPPVEGGARLAAEQAVRIIRVALSRPEHHAKPSPDESTMPSFIFIGGLSAALSVALGAFGAHGLKKVASAEALGWWETAARYHLAIALATVLFGVVRLYRPGGPVAGYALTLGTVLFSGSLYAMTLGAPRWFGAITPLGGLAMIVGLVALAFAGR